MLVIWRRENAASLIVSSFTISISFQSTIDISTVVVHRRQNIAQHISTNTNSCMISSTVSQKRSTNYFHRNALTRVIGKTLNCPVACLRTNSVVLMRRSIGRYKPATQILINVLALADGPRLYPCLHGHFR